MIIDKFDPKDTKETQALTKKYCMPMDSKNFIKWRGKFRRKGYGSVSIEIDTRRYFEQIHDIYKQKNHKGFTLEDIATICQLRYMAASSSIRNADKSEKRLNDVIAVKILLKKIMDDCDVIYKETMARINKQNRKLFEDVGIELAD